jgi:hypothetical protein
VKLSRQEFNDASNVGFTHLSLAGSNRGGPLLPEAIKSFASDVDTDAAVTIDDGTYLPRYQCVWPCLSSIACV